MSPFLASVAAGSVKGFRSAGGGAIWEIVDSVYVYNGGTIYGISDIPNAALDLLPNNSVFMIRYELFVYGGTQMITAAVIRNGYILSQSGLATQNFGNVAYEASAFSQYTQANDDNDGLVMDGNGNYVNPWSANYNKVNSSGQDWAYGYPNGGNSTSSTPFNTPVPNDNHKTLIAFPVTGYSAWVEPWDNAMKVGKSGVTHHSRQTSLGINTHLSGNGNNMANNIWTISDSINSFFIGVWGTNRAKYIEVNLTNGTIYVTTNVTFSNTMTIAGGNINTEEDPFGDQLFSINGAISYYGHNDSTLFIFGGTNGWRNINGNKFSDDCSSMNASGLSTTQTGMDIVTTIDTSRRVYFGDWGHDNGGIYGFGDDNQLGLRRTNIRKLNSTSTPSSL